MKRRASYWPCFSSKPQPGSRRRPPRRGAGRRRRNFAHGGASAWRDARDDYAEKGRIYFKDIDFNHFTEETKKQLEDEIEKKLYYLVTHSHKNLTIVVHPIVHSYLTKGFFSSIIKKWRKKHKVKVKAQANTNYHLTEFRFFDEREEEIKF